MRKFINIVAVASLLVLSLGAFAQGSKTGMHSKMAVETMSGIVKGMPEGNTFTLAMKGKTPVKINAAKAAIRMKGKFMSIRDLKGGSIVTVTGMTMGDHVMASKVDVKSIPGKPMKAAMTKTKSGKLMPGKN